MSLFCLECIRDRIVAPMGVGEVLWLCPARWRVARSKRARLPLDGDVALQI